MATYLLDTTVFSLLVKQHPGVRARLSTLELTHRIVICTVVRGEVLYGLELMARGKKRQCRAPLEIWTGIMSQEG